MQKEEPEVYYEEKKTFTEKEALELAYQMMTSYIAMSTEIPIQYQGLLKHIRPEYIYFKCQPSLTAWFFHYLSPEILNYDSEYTEA